MNYGHALAIPVDDAVVGGGVTLRGAQGAAVGQRPIPNNWREQGRAKPGDRSFAQLHTTGIIGNPRRASPLRKHLGCAPLVAKDEDRGGIGADAEDRPVVRCRAAPPGGEEKAARDGEGVGVTPPRRAAATFGDGRANRDG